MDWQYRIKMCPGCELPWDECGCLMAWMRPRDWRPIETVYIVGDYL